MNPAPGVYVHIPFCEKKCGYCDFNVYSGYKAESQARYVDALCEEIRRRADGQTILTIFIGGGTPTLLPAESLGRILSELRAGFAVPEGVEITVEANPNDATPEKLSALKEFGVNRLSFGVQTFDDGLLKQIDRVHSARQAVDALQMARAAGFENLSLDLMFGLPRQTLKGWDATLEKALSLNVPHLSMYGLMVEEGTAFWARRERGKLPLPEHDTEAAMFGLAQERAEAAGLRRYELSNYALPGFESKHNSLYWRNDPYFGFGAGAWSYLGGVRARNVKKPPEYALKVREMGWPVDLGEREELTPAEVMGETAMLALRTVKGLDLMGFAERFGVRPETRFEEAIEKTVALGLCELTETHLRLTQRGTFLASDAMAEFVG